MFERHKKHKRGKRTFFFLYVKHGWILTLIGCGILFLTYEIYRGALFMYANDLLIAHPDWYITVPMLSLWLLLIGLTVIFFGFMIAAEHYMHYKFILSDHAFHLNRGLFFVRETTIPYQQISNVHIARPYHYRLFGVAQLDIVTAADKSLSHEENKTKQFLIPVIDTKVARALSEQLITYAAKIRDGIDLQDEDEVLDDDIDPEPINTIKIAPHQKETYKRSAIETPVKKPQHTFDSIGEIDDIGDLEFITDEAHLTSHGSSKGMDHKHTHKDLDGIGRK